MNKPKYDVARAVPDLAGEPAGFAHAMNLLLLAIGKTNPAVGVLLDEFTAMHADYFGELQALARDSDEYLRVLESFSQSAKSIYKRLSSIDASQSAAMRTELHGPVNSIALH